jgi:hypothetical protein
MKKNSFMLCLPVLAIAAVFAILAVSCPTPIRGRAPDKNPAKLDRIEVTSLPDKQTYQVGDELDLKGLVVTAYYDDNTFKPVTAYTASGFDSASYGIKTLTLSYTEKNVTKDASLGIVVIDPASPLTKIEIKSLPDKTVYEYGEGFVRTGMELTITFQNGDTADVSGDVINVTGYNPFPDNDREVTITLSIGNVSVTTKVTVKTQRGPTYKENKNGRQVIMSVWNECPEDPRNVIGYRLKDSRKLFWDHFVFLYGIRLREFDCATRASTRCMRTGVHVCHGLNMFRYIDEWDKYVKPLRDAGIKVLLSIVPADQGYAVGTLYEWPMEEWYPWKDCARGGEEIYPFGEAAVKVLIDQMLELYSRAPFDGIGFDEEYSRNTSGGLNSGHPSGSVAETYRGRAFPFPRADTPNASSGNSTSNVYPALNTDGNMEKAWRNGGRNMLRFMYDVDKAFQERYNKRLIWEAYEGIWTEYIPESMVIDGKTIWRDDYLDWSSYTRYGSTRTHSLLLKEGTETGKFPDSRWGPTPIQFAGANTAGQLIPPFSGTNDIQTRVADHLAGNYGMFLFYSLRARDNIKDNFASFNGRYPEEYFSIMTQTLFGQETEYVGENYPRVWTEGNDGGW